MLGTNLHILDMIPCLLRRLPVSSHSEPIALVGRAQGFVMNCS